jgi:hypothetical protein
MFVAEYACNQLLLPAQLTRKRCNLAAPSQPQQLQCALLGDSHMPTRAGLMRCPSTHSSSLPPELVQHW